MRVFSLACFCNLRAWHSGCRGAGVGNLMLPVLVQYFPARRHELFPPAIDLCGIATVNGRSASNDARRSDVALLCRYICYRPRRPPRSSDTHKNFLQTHLGLFRPCWQNLSRGWARRRGLPRVTSARSLYAQAFTNNPWGVYKRAFAGSSYIGALYGLALIEGDIQVVFSLVPLHSEPRDP